MTRWQFVGAGGLAAVALVATLAAPDLRAQGDDAQIVRAMEEIRDVLQRHGGAAELGDIRQRQRTHFRSTSKFPDYMEVGWNVWHAVHDWHVRHQQPLAIEMLPTGSYGMRYMYTTLVLRPDVEDNHIGLPYDADAPRR